MRDILFNHEALVPAGRAGADIVVGDAAIIEPNGVIVMKNVLSRKGLYLAASLGALIQPRLAQDSKLDMGELFAGVSAKNLPQKKAGIVAALKAVTLAKDQSIEPVLLAFDAMEKEDVPEGADADPSSGLPMNAAEMEKKAKDAAEAETKREDEAKDKRAKDKRAKDKKARDEMFEKAKEGKDEKTCAALDAVAGELDGMDEWPEKKKKDDDKGEDKKGIDKKAMDAALDSQAATIRREMREVAEAREFVEPFVGRVGMAMDSAVEVYKLALDTLKVDVDGVPANAASYKAILRAQRKPGEGAVLTFDEAPLGGEGSSTSKRFGGLDRIAS